MIRVKNAKNYLQRRYSVSYTAELCGFSNRGHFIKVFSSCNGTTPLKYQQSCGLKHINDFHRKDLDRQDEEIVIGRGTRIIFHYYLAPEFVEILEACQGFEGMKYIELQGTDFYITAACNFTAKLTDKKAKTPHTPCTEIFLVAPTISNRS
jgi:hypothetical protein